MLVKCSKVNNPEDQGQKFEGKVTFQSRRPSLYGSLR